MITQSKIYDCFCPQCKKVTLCKVISFSRARGLRLMCYLCLKKFASNIENLKEHNFDFKLNEVSKE